MVVFKDVNSIGNAEGNLCHKSVFRLVFAVTTRNLAHFPENGLGDSRISCKSGNVVGYAVGVNEFLLEERAVLVFILEDKFQSCVNNCLLFEDLAEKVLGDLDIRKHLKVGAPVCDGTRSLFLFLKGAGLHLANGRAFFEGH